jgi:biotin synthase-like enzyme
MGVHRYNHNLETARSYFTEVVTTHTWEERWDTLRMVRDAGMEVCCGGIVGMGETREQRAEFAAQLAELTPDEVPLNFLNPRPGTPFGDKEPLPAKEALRTIAAFRLALPRTILRYAGGREITLGDLGTEQGLLGGINAVIVGNYLTTLSRSAPGGRRGLPWNVREGSASAPSPPVSAADGGRDRRRVVSVGPHTSRHPEPPTVARREEEQRSAATHAW